MKRMGFLLIALVLPGLCADAQQEIYVKPLLTQEVFKTSITRASATSAILAIATNDKKAKVLDIASLSERANLNGLISPVSELSLTASGQSLVTTSGDGQAAFWNTATGAVEKNLVTDADHIVALAMEGETTMYIGGDDKRVRIIDAQANKELGTLSTKPELVTALCLHPFEKILAVGTQGGQVQVYAIGTLTLTHSLQDNKERVTALSFNRNGHLLIAGTSSGNIFIWDTQTWALKTKIAQGKQAIVSLAFDPLLRWLASTSVDSTLRITDLATFARVKTLDDPSYYCTFVSFVNDETLLATTSTGMVKKWRVLAAPPDTLAPKIVLLHPVPTSKDAAVRSVASEYEIHGVAYDDVGVTNLVLNGKPARLTNPAGADLAKIPPGMKGKAFTEKVRLESFGTNTLDVRASDKAGHTAAETAYINHLTPDQSVEIVTPADNAVFNTVSVPLQFKPWFEVESYKIAVNVSDIPTNAVPPGKVAGDVIQDEIPLVVGENQIQLTVFGKEGERYSKSFSVSRKTETAVTLNAPSSGPKKQRGPGPQAWAVIVGLSDYGNKAIPALSYADKDADAFANFLRRPEGGAYDADHLKLLLNKDATLANIKDALINFLNQAIDIDLVIIYFAGHGAPDPARPQNLYLLTYDTDPNMLGTTAFPMWQIQDVLGRYVNAKRVVVFSDACHSGGISVNFATRGMGVNESNQINQYLTDLSKTKEGIVVFTASAAGEVSQEFPELGHGVFTYYLLEGLQGKADFNNDYVITINEAMQYVEEQVKRKTKGAQNPTRSQTAYDKELTIATIAH